MVLGMCADESITDAEQRRSPVEQAERRRHQRTELRANALLVELDERDEPGVPAECNSIHISRSGIGIRSRRMSPAGRRVWIGLLGGSAPRWLFGIVRHANYVDNAEYLLGIEFVVPPARLAPPTIRA
jgi:hypothetical protein